VGIGDLPVIVLGIDPGLANTGYAVVRRAGSRTEVLAHGTLRTAPSTPTEQRLLALHEGLAGVIGETGAHEAAIEAFFVHPVSTSAMGMAAARGALLVSCARSGLAVSEYTPTAIKQAVTGSGRAGKDQVRAMVARLTGVEAGTDHAADAIAAAICHCASGPLREAIRIRGRR
jgi:crossover junction endodeoxyribonuclease RuvC